MIVSNNNLNNNNEYNNKLYNSVFSNIYLKTIIFNHLNIYNILYNNIKFNSIEELEQFKYKEYLNSIKIDIEEYEHLNRLPDNIKHIIFTGSTSKLIKYQGLSNKLDSIEIEDYIEITNLNSTFINSISSKKESSLEPPLLKLSVNSSKKNDYIIKPNVIPQSVTNLYVHGYHQSQFQRNELPLNLKVLSIIGAISFEAVLPKSLTQVYLEQSDISIVNHLSSQSFNNLVKLEFVSNYRLDIISTIKFPNTLQELKISCIKSFNTSLPENLKLFHLNMMEYAYEILFPSSLEYLKVLYSINILDQEIFQNKKLAPCNLKELELNCSNIMDSDDISILPDNLEELIIVPTFVNKVLNINKLPASLKYLKLNSTSPNTSFQSINIFSSCLNHLDLGSTKFNQVIDINVLPITLKTLILGTTYTQIINPLAIPQQLKLLQIENQEYGHSINLPVSTHPYTTILCFDINLYYNTSNTSIRSLRLPNLFSMPLSKLKLQDKSSLEYLHLGQDFNQPIQLSDLPIDNNIKTLVLGFRFSQIINLEYFKNLETIIFQNYSTPTITTKITQQIDNKIYNNYNLKNIIVPYNNNQFLKSLDNNFYQFLKRKQYRIKQLN